MTPAEAYSKALSDMIAKSGVREWVGGNAPAMRAAIIAAANELVIGFQGLYDGEDLGMALPDAFKCSDGTAKTIKSSAGSAAITLASLANGNGTSAGGRQAATIDLGALWARRWRVTADFELAATPTAGNAINLFGSWHSATGAGKGNTSGSDAAYTGYSNNIDASTRQLEFVGAHICTAQAKSTVCNVRQCCRCCQCRQSSTVLADRQITDHGPGIFRPG